jgi:DUF1680 family protein
MAKRVPARFLVDTTSSPHARLRPVALGAVRLEGDFRQPRREINRRLTLPSQYRKCEETGRIDNFRRAAGKIGGAFHGRYYNDSDVYKWIEAVSYALAEGPDPELEVPLSNVIREIAEAQESDGYLNTHFTGEKRSQRWTNLRDWHELYCAGHLMQAAVAHRRCTGREELLTVAVRFADLICDTFGPEGRPGTCGHQEIETALVELYRLTGTRRYLDQARRFIEARGGSPAVIGGSPYHQDHRPFRELSEVTGHAVRMMYYCCGAADLVLETGDPEYAAALERLWRNMTERRMYVTGGIGSRYDGEAFGDDYELPNERAYAESCAAIGSVMWNWRMLQLSGEARYADLIETTLYNAVLPGLSLDGKLYYYENPLADDGRHRRQPWFDCACCPPNLARLLASLPAYFYSTGDDGVWVHQYASGTADLSFGEEQMLKARQETRYPWDGRVDLTVDPTEPMEFTLRLRIPGWATSAEITVNGKGWTGPAEPGTYAEIRRTWRAGDEVVLHLPMKAQWLRSHPRVANNCGRVALLRGPLVYCVEHADLGSDPRDLIVLPERGLTEEWNPELLSGVVSLRGDGLAVQRAGEALYSRHDEVPPAHFGPTPFRAVPYYAWGNREAGPMAVWLTEGPVPSTLSPTP